MPKLVVKMENVIGVPGKGEISGFELEVAAYRSLNFGFTASCCLGFFLGTHFSTVEFPLDS